MSSDRKTLIRLASSLPKGSDERRTLLASLQKVALTVDASNEEAVRSIAQDIKGEIRGSVDVLVKGSMIRFELWLGRRRAYMTLTTKGLSFKVPAAMTGPFVDMKNYEKAMQDGMKEAALLSDLQRYYGSYKVARGSGSGSGYKFSV